MKSAFKTLSMALLFLVIAIPLSSAITEVYEIGFEVSSNYSIGINSLGISEWYPTKNDIANETEAFNITLFSNNGEYLYSLIYESDFILLSNPPVILDSQSIELYFPKYDNARYVRIYHNKTLKLEFDIQEALCDGNSVCESFENYRSCPSDCGKFEEDGYCASVSYDAGCDPDCHPSIDMDCSCPNNECEEWENHKICSQDCNSGSRDGYCDGLEDGKCDPDCIGPQDPDCRIEAAGISESEISWLWILIPIAIVILIVAFLLYKRGSETEIGNNLRKR